MAQPSELQMTRSSSTTSSVLSNINVKSSEDHHDGTESVHSISSTPPTSYDDSGSLNSQKTTPRKDVTVRKTEHVETGSRSSRKRKVINYNENALTTSASAATSRNVSGLTGKTLVHDDDESIQRVKKRKTGSDTSTFPEDLPPRLGRATSVKDRVKRVAKGLVSVLGKRTRPAEPKSKLTKELETGKKGLLYELDLDAEDEAPAAHPAKKLKKAAPVLDERTMLTTAVNSTRNNTVKTRKQWLDAGLYVGQEQSDDGKQVRRKLQKRPDAAHMATKKPLMPLPMFKYLDHTRDFVIPFDIFAPSFKKGDEKPKDWHQLNRNRLVGDAKDLWEKEAPMARSLCICKPPALGEKGCDDDCINRAMHYECGEDNCALTPIQCGNRAFADLTRRLKKGGQYDVGVEVVKTADRGFGVRACRAFPPGDIIMEYTGEIISEGECQRRMREVYSGKQSYYIMEFDQGLHIDGTRGSMARFVNHSCEPNCEVRMVKVGGIPRMAIYAGEAGVPTGAELSYDYNFDNFSENKQACYCGAPTCRGHLARKLNAAEQKQKVKDDKERQILAEIEAKKQATRDMKMKTEKAKRGSGWRGWVTLAEVKEELKQTKAALEDAEKTSARAQRLAARHDPAQPVKENEEKLPRRASRAVQSRDKTDEARPTHKRTISAVSAVGSSRFSEDLPRSGDNVALTEIEALVTAEVTIGLHEALSKHTELDEETSRQTELDTDDQDVRACKPVPITEVNAISKGKSMLKSVEHALKKSLKQSTSKLMRQGTLSFGKVN